MLRVRGYAVVVSVALLAATLSPLVRDPAEDGFPLSTYPMFAYARPTRVELGYAVGQTATGSRHLTPSLIGAGEVLQAMSVVETAIYAGKRELDRLCHGIAARVAADDHFTDVVAIRIVWATIDAAPYLIENTPASEAERAHCVVPR